MLHASPTPAPFLTPDNSSNYHYPGQPSISGADAGGGMRGAKGSALPNDASIELSGHSNIELDHVDYSDTDSDADVEDGEVGRPTEDK